MWILLADPPGGERERVRQAGVPRSTYQTVRRRAFFSRWLSEHYVPNPTLVGARSVRFFLAQPYAERWREALRRSRALAGLVVLWASPETLFGVTFEGTRDTRWELFAKGELFRRSWSVASSIPEEGVLAYFDFEGAWSRSTLNREPLSYPRGLPRGGPARSRPLALRTSFLTGRWVLSRGDAGQTAGIPSRLPRRERRLIADGWFSRIVVPNLEEVPRGRGWMPLRVVFVTATWRTDVQARSLLTDLVERGRVMPFVFAYDDERVLFAALSPANPPLVAGRTPIIDLLGAHLAQVEVLREPIDTLFPLVDHRYERLSAVAAT